MILRQTLLFLARRKELEDFLRQSRKGHEVRGRFMAGGNRGEVLEKARDLARKGFAVTLDYLGEDPSDGQPRPTGAQEYLQAVEDEALDGFDACISVKPSLLGARENRDEATERWLGITRKAAERGRRLRIDREESDLAETALHFVRTGHRECGNAAVVIPSQMKRSGSDLDLLIQDRIPACLVKGAFLEPEEICFQDREEVVLYFMRLVETIMRGGVNPVIATHDPRLVEFAIDMAFIFNREPADFEFQMLYGINVPLQQKLVAEGYRVRINLPYGNNWYGYFMQRLAERPTRLWFLLRNQNI